MASPPREVWLDGLRGVAALIVAWLHLTAGQIHLPYRSFWAEPASENRSIIQIAPFRLIFSGEAMVCIFFVVSGYSISTNLIKLRNDGQVTDFYQKLASSVVRRMFRLLFPVVVVMLITHVLWYAGFFMEGQFGPDEGCPGTVAWSSPLPHLQCLGKSFISLVSLDTDQHTTLNSHFWTIPVEIRGSMKVYTALLGLSTIGELPRLLALGAFVMRFWWIGYPEFLAFFAGSILAELDASALSRSHDLQLPSPSILSEKPQLTISKPTQDKLTTILHYLVFAVGVYLLCLPPPVWEMNVSDPTFTPDWFFLAMIPPLPWWNWFAQVRTWHVTGAIMTVNGIRCLPRLKAPFESRLAQLLGHISFSLYLCHQTIYRVLFGRLLNWTSFALSGHNYWGAVFNKLNGVLVITWIVSITVIGSVLLLVSRYLTKNVDQKGISLAFQLEKLLSGT